MSVNITVGAVGNISYGYINRGRWWLIDKADDWRVSLHTYIELFPDEADAILASISGGGVYEGEERETRDLGWLSPHRISSSLVDGKLHIKSDPSKCLVISPDDFCRFVSVMHEIEKTEGYTLNNRIGQSAANVMREILYGPENKNEE